MEALPACRCVLLCYSITRESAFDMGLPSAARKGLHSTPRPGRPAGLYGILDFLQSERIGFVRHRDTGVFRDDAGRDRASGSGIRHQLHCLHDLRGPPDWPQGSLYLPERVRSGKAGGSRLASRSDAEASENDAASIAPSGITMNIAFLVGKGGAGKRCARSHCTERSWNTDRQCAVTLFKVCCPSEQRI